MEKIIISTPDSISAIITGAKWEAVVKLLPEKGVAVVTDNNVFDLYGADFPDFPVLKIKPGEQSKQLKVIGNLSKKLLDIGIDRTGFILAIGGGVVCDIAGFLASVYMRGIRCGFVSTSLLSQVDASTGGKNGVNIGDIKNVIGNFKQPEFVICDTAMLGTLPEEEYFSGLAELIKTGIIGDRTIVNILEKNHTGIINRDKNILSDLVAKAVKFKAKIVSKDEKESGLRRILNFGHTFGHAVELHAGVRHGFAVASGMELATFFSYKRGLIKKAECNKIIDLLKKYNFTGNFNIPEKKFRELILNDKKRYGRDINFVFVKGIGKAVVKKITVQEVIDFYRYYKSVK